ncbi:hypothetical protein [Anaerocolumna xylanovorans]|uniref:Uncharacterized protein n=1 Tax=Anaerocolumna xylanovorans DSM 12503 TaxID=1121345 RepID=A0A1M7Y3M2_9FIRM|nr:hypothetical protein [Anaerocolumna xylanovorans]SHO46797.1 hypothetical protein SAMN02745217_01291 [Anaerocolumna xylanovorans DSM 12503]
MSMTASRDIAPDFIDMLSKLPLDIVNAMESSYAAGLMDRKITQADRSILRSIHDEQLKRQHKAVFLPEAKKCLHCHTYHPQDKQHCPECGRYLYSCGDIYQPKVRKKVQG